MYIYMHVPVHIHTCAYTPVTEVPNPITLVSLLLYHPKEWQQMCGVSSLLLT